MAGGTFRAMLGGHAYLGVMLEGHAQGACLVRGHARGACLVAFGRMLWVLLGGQV